MTDRFFERSQQAWRVQSSSSL